MCGCCSTHCGRLDLSLCVIEPSIGAALCWWLALTLSWGLAAVFKWSSEAIATRSALLHVLGWAVPAILTLIGVSKQEVGEFAFYFC